MEAPLATLSPLTKTLKLEYENQKFICKIQTIEDSLDVSLFLNNTLKYKGYISLNLIKEQIHAFFDYDINGVFDEIMLLNQENFLLIKEYDKYKLKIKFIIFRK